MTQKILIYGETDEEGITSLTKETLGIAKKLSLATGASLHAVFIGDGIAGVARQAAHYGAGTVHLVDRPELKDCQPELLTDILEQLCRKIGPEILLLGHNLSGADIAPRIAYRLKVGLIMDCVDLSTDPATRRLLATKPVYGGNVMSVFSSEDGLQVATIRQKAFAALEPDTEQEGKTVYFDPKIDLSKQNIRIIEKIEDTFPGVKLEDAEAIICGGRGVGSQEAFAGLEELANIMGGAVGGAVGGTRPTCEKGWLHPRLQIGLTGEKVAPRIYMAVGVSGAVQHTAGITGAKNIIAINKDRDANIFRVAHFGAVGDYKDILPSFRAKIEEHFR